MTLELYINGQAVDLDQKSVIALSFAVNTLNEMKTLNGNVSNRIVLPPTSNNLRVMGFVGNVNAVLTDTVRKKLIAKFVQNGTEVIPEGVVDIGTVNSKGISIVITSGNVDFFDAIEGSLQDLRFPEYDHVFGNIQIADSRLRRDGYIYPIVNYGNMTDASDNININFMRPAMFVSTLVKKIVNTAGFVLLNELETNVRTADQYSRMILPFSNDAFTHGQRFIDVAKSYEMRLRQTALPRVYNYDNSPIDDNYALVRFDTIVSGSSSNITQSGIYNAPGKFVADIQVTFPSIVFEAVGVIRQHTLQLVKRNEFGMVTVLNEAVLTSPNVKPSYPYTNIVLKAQGVRIKDSGINEQYYVRSNSRVVPSGSIDLAVDRPVSFSITSVGGTVTPGENVELEATLPDIPKKDFLKAVANWFGGVVQTDNQNKTVSIVPFFKIVENVSKSVDWSSKIVDPDSEGNEINIGQYGQLNPALYKNDNSLEPKDYGSGTFAIADKNLPLKKTLFELPFSASLDSFVMSGISAVLIKKFEAEDSPTMTTSTQPRVAMVSFIDTEVTYKTDDQFSNIVSNSIPRTYFTGSPAQRGLSMQEMIDAYYPELIIMLNDQRKKSLKLYLREPDISDLNFFIPVYLKQFAAYFYISKITDYVGERPCTVELIKLF